MIPRIENVIKAGGSPQTGCQYWESLWASVKGSDLTIRLLDSQEVMKPETYTSIWQDYRDMGLSSNGVLNFQEAMIYYFPGKILSPHGDFEVPKPCVHEVWGDRRNVTNFRQEEGGLPRRISRHPYRIVISRLALDIRDVLMNLHPAPTDTLH